MPTYEYVCDGCGHEFELFQMMTDSVKRKCPECSKQKLRRLIGSGGAIIFKGSGFFETDYRSDSYKKDAAAYKKSASETPKSKKDDKKAKPDAKKKSEPKKKDG